ncbi:MAG: hypothetical protein R3A10_18005 [Caldilineaceae bacterium]
MAATDVVATDAVDTPVTVPLDARPFRRRAPSRWTCSPPVALPPVPTHRACHPELVERRDAFLTCAYDMGQGRIVAVVSQTPRHYRDK